MPKYIVCLVDAYTREIIETEDEVFDNEGDAEAYSLECGSAFSEGAEVLAMAGREFIPREDVDYVVIEIDE